MRKFASKKGMSLIEVVIALAVVMAVSVASITIVSASITDTAKGDELGNMRTVAQNGLECFKCAGDEFECYSLVNTLDGLFSYNSAAGSYDLAGDYYTLHIVVDYGAERPCYTAEVQEIKNGKSTLLLSYVKG